LINASYWTQDQNAFGFAIDNNDKLVPVTSVLSTVPMWFGLLDEAKAESTITQISSPDHQADWGMRIISKQNPNYGPDGYHYGAVWPLFTGWAATGEYRYHRTFPAYANLRANALLALDGSLGHVTEVLSGDYYQPTVTSSPHQIWSAAMVVNPLLRGLLGLDVNAANHRVAFAPHIPAGWNSFSVSNLRIGKSELSLKYMRTADSITLESEGTGAEDCLMDFAPALSLRAQVVRAELNGKTIEFHAKPNTIDQHVEVHFPACGASNKLVMRLRNDFGLSFDSQLPALGTVSEGMRMVSESWSEARDKLTLEAWGDSGQEYDLAVLNASQVRTVDGAELVAGKLHLRFPAGTPGVYSQQSITLHFADARRGR
jgi:hypothetical protein